LAEVSIVDASVLAVREQTPGQRRVDIVLQVGRAGKASDMARWRFAYLPGKCSVARARG
jgi:hypothetical protein